MNIDLFNRLMNGNLRWIKPGVKNQLNPLRFAAAMAAICIYALAAFNAGAFDQQDLFIAGQNGYHTYRIPSLIKTKDGTLLAFCEARKNSASDTGDIDLVLKRSTDKGETWSKQEVIWDDGTNTCGNPCPVVDRETGTVWLLLTHNLGEDHEREIKAGTAKGSRTVWITKSDDNGKSWSEFQNITASTKKKTWGWYATGPGRGIQILGGAHSGRLIIPCDHSVTPTAPEEKILYGSHVIYSDNHGKSWKIGGAIYPGMNECQVVELADRKGTLLLSMRNHPKGVHRAQSFSRDGGANWDPIEFQSQLIDPTCQASILRFNWPGKGGPGRILFSNPASDRRRNMTVRVSYDDGKTWPISKVLHEDAAAYSCLAALSLTRAACLYERGRTNAYEKITFARFSLEWLEKKDRKTATSEIPQ